LSLSDILTKFSFGVQSKHKTSRNVSLSFNSLCSFKISKEIIRFSLTRVWPISVAYFSFGQTVCAIIIFGSFYSPSTVSYSFKSNRNSGRSEDEPIMLSSSFKERVNAEASIYSEIPESPSNNFLSPTTIILLFGYF
jgi:hypothetical protein